MPPLPRFQLAASVLAAAWLLPSCVLANGGPELSPGLERLGRGLVAVRGEDGSAAVSWRLLATDPEGAAFHLYRSRHGGAPVRLTSTPLAGPTFFTDPDPGDGAPEYSVRMVKDGRDQDRAATAILSPRPWLEIPLQPPPGGTNPDGRAWTYHANDGAIGDVDGDGVHEFVIKWEPSNAKDNSQPGTTGEVLIDCYRIDGTRLWRIDLGRNIRAGAHYTPFVVYDFDGDGRAEIACRTADGSIDGTGIAIGGPTADHRDPSGRILRGPEFLTVFDGLTGAARDTVPYLPARHPETDSPTSDQLKSVWGDGYGNRVDRFLAAPACLDGRSISLIMARGYYTRTVIAAWDLRGGKLVRRWVFDSQAAPGSAAEHSGQGNHQLSIMDVDGDGRDEIIYGSMTLDDDGTCLYSTRLGHGDALHVSDFDPQRPGLEVFSVHEDPGSNGGRGATFRDAKSGEILWSIPSTRDTGRGIAVDIDPRYPGAECWTSDSRSLFDARGNVIGSRRPSSINFAVWWDGDPQRELLDRTAITKWVGETQSEIRLLTAEGCSANNGTKATPVLSGDLFGDWREEVVWRTADSSALRIYTTTVPTPHRLVTLLHDRAYRLALAWQNSGYNQPPHPSFDMASKLNP